MSQRYEVELRLPEGSRLLPFERPLTHGEQIVVQGVAWRVSFVTRPKSPRAGRRYVCVPVRAAAKAALDVAFG